MARKLKKGARISERLLRLFAGWNKAHGEFKPGKQTKVARGKIKGGQSTALGAPTEELWEKHLSGEIGLGVYMLRADGTVRFAAIDVDVYPLDLEALAKKIATNMLPLIVCRSKSGGAHLYLFCSENIPAGIVRQKLAEWALVLGLYTLKGTAKDKVEFFPHKDRLASGNDFGKYINMPYFKGTVDRYAVDATGAKLPVEVFIQTAEQASVTLKQLQSITTAPGVELEDAPPCLQSLLANGPATDFKNNTLLNLGVYLRQRYPDTWQDQLELYNREYIEPPLVARDVLKIIKTISKTSYNFMCSQEPISGLCNTAVCITRKFGVRAKAEDSGQGSGFNLNLGQLTKFTTIPPTWELEVNGVVLRLDTDQLMSYARFRKAVLEALNVLPVLLKAETWNIILDEKLNNLEEVIAPTDAGQPGRIQWYLEQFCVRLRARVRDELKDGKVWWDEKNKRVYFRLHPFMENLIKHRVYEQSREITSLFRSWSFKHGQFNIKGVCVQWWCMPEFNVQNEPDEVPRPGQIDTRL